MSQFTGSDFTALGGVDVTNVTFTFAPNSTEPTPPYALIEIIDDELVEVRTEVIIFDINITRGLGQESAEQGTISIADNDG